MRHQFAVGAATVPGVRPAAVFAARRPVGGVRPETREPRFGFAPQQRHRVAEISVEKVVVGDERRDPGIAEHRRSEIVEREPVARQRSQEAERGRSKEQLARGGYSQAGACGEALAILRPGPQQLENLELHAGVEDLGIDESRAKIEQSSRPAPCDSAGQRGTGRPALKSRVGDEPAAPGPETVADPRVEETRSDRKGGHRPAPSPAQRQAATRASSFGKKAVVCALISARSSERPGHGGMESDRRLDQSLEPGLRAADPKLRSGVRAVAPGVLADRLSEFARVAEHVAQIVGDLIGLAQRVAEPPPWFGIGRCRCRARERRSDEQGAGLSALIVGERDGGFAFPGLPCDDAAGRPNRRRDDRNEPRPAARLGRDLARQHLERHHNQRVSGQHRDRRAELRVNGRLAASGVGVVETGQIVVDERSAMQEFDRCRGGRGRGRMRVAAGRRDREAELGPDPMSARKDRVVEGRREQRRRPGALRETDRALKSLFDALRRLHGSLPPFVRLTCRLYMSIYIDTSLRTGQPFNWRQ